MHTCFPWLLKEHNSRKATDPCAIVQSFGVFLSTGVFEVEKINPPPQSLGIHHLPVDTHNGDQITVEDEVIPNNGSTAHKALVLLNQHLIECLHFAGKGSHCNPLCRILW